MPDWPQDMTEMSPFGILAVHGEVSPALDACVMAHAVQTIGGVLSATANLAIYYPILLRRWVTVYQMGWANGGTISGNVDVGIYDRRGNRLVSAGSTLQAGANAPQIVNVTDTPLGPGLYYMAMAMDNTTGFVLRAALVTQQFLRAYGCAQQATAFPLPATATFAACAQGNVPQLFAAISSSVI